MSPKCDVFVNACLGATMSCVLKNAEDMTTDYRHHRTSRLIAALKRQLKRFIDRRQHSNVVVVHHYHEHLKNFTSSCYKKSTLNRGTSPTRAAVISCHLQVESPAHAFSLLGTSPSTIASNFKSVTRPATAPNFQLLSPPASCMWYRLRTLIILAAHDRAMHSVSNSRHHLADSPVVRAKRGKQAVLRLQMTLL
ncbi:hypothetical protein J6590_059227 [Homalodisca vitripennis]|nr:hypothetical protein J6590_059227 [Homalodisca vitripennis]